MSGGSYDYLCYVEDLQDLLNKRRALEEMAERLGTMNDKEFPGVTAVASETYRIITFLQLWDTHISARIDILKPVWKAVEWRDSYDWSDKEIIEALKSCLE